MRQIPLPIGIDDQWRFWLKVDKRGDCWLWTAGRFTAGYGVFKINKLCYYAHRLSWAMHFKEDPGQFELHHTCLNPACVNPLHLQKVTRSEHQKLTCASGEQSNEGELNSRAKFNVTHVLAIRALHDAGVRIRDIHKKFNWVEYGTLSMIVRRKNWTHI